MKEFLIIAFLLVAIGVICLVLLQQGKGAGMGASFGAGASATLFGSSGAGNFLTRMTAVLAALFFIICLTLANLGSRVEKSNDASWDNLEIPSTPTKVTLPSGSLNIPSDVPATVAPAETDNKDTVADIPQ